MSGTILNVMEVKDSTSEASTEEYVGLSKKQKLLPGDSVLYRHENTDDKWAPVYGTVLTRPSKFPLQASQVESSVKSVDPSLITPNNETSSLSGEVKVDEEDLVHVRWAHSSRIVPVTESKLCLVDRVLERGQLVRNKEGMLGAVAGREVRATIQMLGKEHVIKDVPVTKLYPMTPFVRGQYIVYKDWVGIITTVKRNLYFRLDGGFTFYLESVENDGFEKTDIYNVADTACPGTRIERLPFSIFRRAKWLPAPMKFLSKWFPPVPYLYSFSPVTTARSHVVGLNVEWLWCPKSTENSEPPKKELFEEHFKDVVPIGVPSWELVHLNSIRIHRLKPDDQLTTFTSWLNNFRSEYMDFMAHQNVQDNQLIQIDSNPEVEIPVKVILCQTYLQIDWEDGTKEHILGTKVPEVCQFEINATHPPGLVVAHALEGNDHKYGVVQFGNLHESKSNKTIPVKWITFEPGEGNESEILDINEQDESVYDVKHHSQYWLYQRGTLVIFDSPIDGLIGGTVVDVDIRAGQMIVGSPLRSHTVGVYPHSTTPVSKRCVWNFFVRQWITMDLLPPPHHLWAETENFDEENPGIVLNIQSYSTTDVTKARKWTPELPAFQLLESAPKNHKFFDRIPQDLGDSFHRALQQEFNFLQEHLKTTGIWIRGYEDRMDLVSVLLLGEIETPYEDGLFMFDVHLTPDFPKSMPNVKFVVYSGRLSPFTDVDGTFCTSKLNWEFETQPDSYLLDLCYQLQRILFHTEPFYEDGRNKSLKGTPLGQELSRDYNERVFIQVLTSFHNMAYRPHAPWQWHMSSHLENTLPYKIREVQQWLRTSAHAMQEETDFSEDELEDQDVVAVPPYPLLPLSQGFQKAFNARYAKMQQFFQVNQEEDVSKEGSEPSIVIEEDKETSLISFDDESSSISKSGASVDETHEEEEVEEVQEISVSD